MPASPSGRAQTGLLSIAFVLPILLAACSVERSWRRAARHISSSALRAHVEYLTRDEFLGRRALSPQAPLALGYIQAVLTSFQLASSIESVELRRTTITEGRLTAALPSSPAMLRLELEPERDFVLRAAPASESIDVELGSHETPTLAAWHQLRSHHGREALLRKDTNTLRIALSPRAVLATKGAKFHLSLRLAHAPFRATRLAVAFPGSEKCQVQRRAHVDGLGASFPGAADSAVPAAMLLEMARVLALTKLRPRCHLQFIFSTVGEWLAEDHAPRWAPPWMVEKRHLPKDRIDAQWDWEALKKNTQDELVMLSRAQ